MAATQLLRIATLSKAEQTAIGILTPQERKAALLEAAKVKWPEVDKEIEQASAIAAEGEIQS